MKYSRDCVSFEGNWKQLFKTLATCSAFMASINKIFEHLTIFNIFILVRTHEIEML